MLYHLVLLFASSIISSLDKFRRSLIGWTRVSAHVVCGRPRYRFGLGIAGTRGCNGVPGSKILNLSGWSSGLLRMWPRSAYCFFRMYVKIGFAPTLFLTLRWEMRLRYAARRPRMRRRHLACTYSKYLNFGLEMVSMWRPVVALATTNW